MATATKADPRDMTYFDWMAKVDACVERRLGLSVHALAVDTPFRRLHEAGLAPDAAAETAILDAKGR